MSSSDANTSPDWRVPGRRTSPKSSAPPWRRDDGHPFIDRHRLRHNVAITLGITAFLALLCVTVWVSTWFRLPRRVDLILVGAGYETNLSMPTNLWGWIGLQDFAKLGDPNGPETSWDRSLIKVHGPQQLTDERLIKKAIHQATAPTIVLMVAAHGAADNSGPYIIPQNINTIGDLSSSIIRVSDIINEVALLPESTHKLVIFDTTGLEECASLGVLDNQFAQSLRALDRLIASVPNLSVLCASDEGQRSWSCAPWRQTVFGHYVVAGLEGRADYDHDGRVSGTELSKYVTDRVEKWSWSNREVAQRPFSLPSGEVGDRRGNALTLSYIRGVPSHDDRKLANWDQYLPEIENVWRSYQKVAAQKPGPEVYSPYLFRRYKDLILRYEELLLSGQSDVASTIKVQIDDLAVSIDRIRMIPISSALNSLAMPAAVGECQSNPTQAVAWLNEIWSADGKKFDDAWGKICAQADPNHLGTIRLPIMNAILDRVSADPVSTLSRAVDLVHRIADPRAPLPAEIHYMVMLARDLPAGSLTGASVDLVREALRTRKMAERVALGVKENEYSYSIEIRPWISSDVEKGDVNRRLAEDLLFATDPAEQPRAWSNIERAQATYRIAEGRANLLRLAFATRDQAFSQLPFYSHWLCHRLPRTGSSPNRQNNLHLELVTGLWQKSHDLEAILSHVPEKEDESINRLQQLTTEIQTGLEDIQRVYVDHCEGLLRLQLPEACREIECARLVPLPAPALRRLLLAHEDLVARKLITETMHTGQIDVIATTTSTESRYAFGQRVGKIILAEFNPNWFNSITGDGSESYQLVNQRLISLLQEPNASQSLVSVGMEIRRRLVAIPNQIMGLQEAYLQGDSRGSTDAIEEADQLNRCAAGSLAVDPVVRPTEWLRKHRLQNLLLWQAKRTVEDHWYSEDPAAPPYFRVTGNRYTADAGSLAANADERQQVSDTESYVDRPSTISVLGSEDVYLTSEETLGIDYRLHIGKETNVPAGIPVVSTVVGEKLTLMSPAPGARQLEPIDPGGSDAVVSCTISSPLVNAAEKSALLSSKSTDSTIQIDGLFRGQRLSRSTTVHIRPTPEVAFTDSPAPHRGSLAVSLAPGIDDALGTSDASIVIVLDASGSMGPTPGTNFNSTTKYAEATKALEQVLRGLPNGVTLSLWVFGEAYGSDKTTDAPEKTIRRIQTPATWNHNDQKQIDDLMTRVRYPAVEPWNESPIVRAMVYAKQDLAQATGPQMMVVITDGHDNRLATDVSLNPQGQDVATFLLETFGNTNIEVNVVGFQVESKNADVAKQQFDAVRYFHRPGKWYTASNASELVSAIQSMIRPQLRYLVERENSVLVSGMAKTGIVMSPPGGELHWLSKGVPSGGYLLRLAQKPAITSNVVFEPGDLLVARLTSSDQRPTFQRSVFAADQFPWKPFLEKSGWRISVLQNQSIEGERLAMLVALERLVSPSETTLQLVRPRQVWWEVCSQDTPSPNLAQSWSSSHSFPAPCWNLSAGPWPKQPTTQSPAAPIVRVWWSPDLPAPPAVRLQQGVDFQTLSDLRGRVIELDDRTVKIEQVAIETHEVPTDRGERESIPCLVVRLAHSPDSMIWAGVRGQGFQGREHRYFTAPGKYTGLFWPGTDPASGQIELELFSLATFKREAEGRNCFAELRGLSPPDPNDAPPKAPVSFP